MAFLEWSESLATGIPSVDADHRVLIDLINQLDAGVGDREERATLGTVLNTLVDYTAYHFAREERIMEASGYPRLAEHKLEHEGLTEKVIDLQCRFLDYDKDVVGSEVLDFLKEWLFSHIQEKDMDYRPFVEGNEAAMRLAETIRPVRAPEDQTGWSGSEEFDWSGLKVLIVDDNLKFRTVMATILEAVSVAEVETADSGARGLERLQDFRPDVVLSDWRMEGMDGIELVGRLRDPATSPVPGVPVIMITGYGDAGLRDKALAAGATSILEKPITPRRLLEAIVLAVEGK